MKDNFRNGKNANGRPRLGSALRDLFGHRDLIWLMTVSQIRARYKQSLFGFAWAVLQPLALMLIFTFVFSRLLGVEGEGFPYPLFSYSALIFWSFFSTSLTLGVPSLVLYSAILKKVYFPREIIPLVTVLASLFDLCFAGFVFALLAWFYGVGVTWTILWLPVLLAVQVVLTLGIVFFAATVCVKFRDVQWGVPVLTQLWLYCTPIIYSLQVVPPKFRWILLLNPMTGLVDGYRQVLLHQASPNPLHLLISGFLALVVFVVGYRYLKKREMTFADIV